MMMPFDMTGHTTQWQAREAGSESESEPRARADSEPWAACGPRRGGVRATPAGPLAAEAPELKGPPRCIVTTNLNTGNLN